MRYKVSIIGAGNVGANIAMCLASKNFADIVLLDIVSGVPQGKGLDISESRSIVTFDSYVVGSCDYEDVRDSDIVVITAGMPRKSGMSRDELLKTNAQVVAQASKNIARVAPSAIIVMVTNPLDVMAFVAKEITGFSANKVLGMAGVLDSARFSYFIAREIGVSIENVQTMVLGGHGDNMVPLLHYTTVAGIPITNFISESVINRLVDRMRNGGAEIVGYLKTGSAFYAPAASVVEMVECIFRDKKKILPAAAFVNGEYGADGIYIGVPVKLGETGIEEIIEIPLSTEENISLKESISAVKKLTDSLDIRSLRSV